MAQMSRSSSPRIAHVNYVWLSLDDVTYPRYAPSQERVPVARLNDSDTVDWIDPQFLLKTTVFGRLRKVYSHCTHYYQRSSCALGDQCGFIHVVTVDPTAPRRRRVRHRASAKAVNPLEDDIADSSSTPYDESDRDVPSVEVGHTATTQSVGRSEKQRNNPLMDVEPTQNLGATGTLSSRASSVSSQSSRSSRQGWYRNPYSTSDQTVVVAMTGIETTETTAENHHDSAE
jgi:hypothetical protein